ncbi:hypothetical protein [Bradyrhizobium sp. STM 3562]|uniref:hypothetical protein n=1 Tax=Bradyrhizobium sp. STM 3562 TaxID=578924 RepID=UPI00388F812D
MWRGQGAAYHRSPRQKRPDITQTSFGFSGMCGYLIDVTQANVMLLPGASIRQVSRSNE